MASDYKSPSREQVWTMFDGIAHRYDVLNRILSLRRDVLWRKKIAQVLPQRENQQILDLATGTADVLLSLCQNSGKIGFGIGIDRALNMLDIGRRKIKEYKCMKKMILIPADAIKIPFRENFFDAVTIAFGIRNFVNIERSLREILRVLNPGGKLIVLEFSLPRNRLIQKVYLYYFRKILPTIGGFISGDRKAYEYLNQTVETFPYGKAFVDLMSSAGFTRAVNQELTFGIASLYHAEKPL
jgi:demethylmenaquinone methyltransferase/2-methoxy-6-polyprenyl-1,4-benzoquinol methylase